jgi:hypothetical protein
VNREPWLVARAHPLRITKRDSRTTRLARLQHLKKTQGQGGGKAKNFAALFIACKSRGTGV